MRAARIGSTSGALLIAALSISTLDSQTPTTLPFSISVQQTVQGTMTTVSVANGGSIPFSADGIGLPTDAIVTVTHLGVIPVSTLPNPPAVGTATISAVTLSGSTDFSVTGIPDPGQSFAVGQPFALDVRYKPSTSLAVQSVLTINYAEQPPNTSTNVTPKAILGSFSLNLSGVAPQFTFAYQPPPGNNTTPLQPNGSIVFPVTNAGTVAAPIVAITNIVVTNIGSGPGVVSDVVVSGASDFAAVNLPPPSTTVASQKTLTFGVSYSPLAVETAMGAVRIDFIGQSVMFSLTATSQGAVYAYAVLGTTSAKPVLPGQTISLPDTLLSATTPGTVMVTVQNTGNAIGVIPNIDVSGAGFTLTQVPFVPLMLSPGGSASFTVNFTPTQTGPVSGGLRIGMDTFIVTGNGLGQTLVYSFIAGGISTMVQNNGSVIFTPVAVGLSSTLVFQITNSGTAPGAVNSISVSQPSGAPAPPNSALPIFSISQTPPLPASIAAGATLSFTVTFAPNVVSSLAGVLRIDSLSFPISGVGNPPNPMPDYHFTGASGTQDSLQQIGTGLTLASAYPLDLNGTLTLTFNSDVFSNDPAVQFAIGGRTVTFTIAAGSTQAVFPNGSTQLGLQTGTVAGTITLTPSFITDGGINLTPAIPPSLNLTVAQTAPRLLSVQVASKTSNTLTLQITGYATGRALTEVDIQFAPTSGENVGTTKLSVPVGPSFTAWYQSAASQPFGSQFTVMIPLTFEGDLVTVTTLTAAVQSASVTLTNNQGVSAAQTVSLQ